MSPRSKLNCCFFWLIQIINTHHCSHEYLILGEVLLKQNLYNNYNSKNKQSGNLKAQNEKYFCKGDVVCMLVKLLVRHTWCIPISLETKSAIISFTSNLSVVPSN